MATAGNKSINAKLKEIGREKRRKPDRTITSSASDSDNDSNYTGGEKSEAELPNDSINIDGGVGQSSTRTSQCRSLVSSSSQIAKRTKRSLMWKYFRIEKEENGEERVYSLKCPKTYSYFPNSGTSNLKRHHNVCSKNSEDDRKVVKIDEKVAREKFTRAIIQHDLPFSCVEYTELRDYISYIYPDYKC